MVPGTGKSAGRGALILAAPHRESLTPGHCAPRHQKKNEGSRRQRRGKDNEDRPPQRRNKLWLDPSDARLPFACPFYYNSKEEHRGCLNYKLNRIGDVRQHIRRHHVQPSYCPRCNVEFQGDITYERRDAHVSLRACTDTEIHEKPSGATSYQIQEMNNAANHGRSSDDIGRWYAIWTIMFPGTMQPPSPYINVGDELRNVGVHAYVEGYRQNGGVQAFLHQLGVNVDGWGVLNDFLDHLLNYNRSLASAVDLYSLHAASGGMMQTTYPRPDLPDLLPRPAQSDPAYVGGTLRDHDPDLDLDGGFGSDNDGYVTDH